MVSRHTSNLPSTYLWIEDVSAITNVDEAALIKLCEQQYIQSTKFGGRWAVHIVNINEVASGTVMVRDLHAGGHITIGDIISNFHIDDSEKRFGLEAMRTQRPAREKIEEARNWIRVSWYLLAGGAVFALVGLVLTWPLASIASIPAWLVANQAVSLAKSHGDKALVDDAKRMMAQAQATFAILWGVILLFICIIIGLAAT